MKTITSIAAFVLLLSPAFAQVAAPEETPAPAQTVTTSVAPQEVREVVAEGKAAIGTAGILGARRAAEAQALRNAVEKALGVYVSAHSLTKNYALVRDQVLTRSEGYATLKEVVREEVGTEDVTVTVRALVTLKPLAEQLKALKLTRAFRVCVQVKGDAATRQPVATAAAELENRLAEAGFVVVDDSRNADLLIKILPRFTTSHETPLDTAAGAMTMYAVDGQTTVQAVRVGTGEIVAAFAAHDTANHISLNTARAETVQNNIDGIRSRLIDALMVLPAAHSQSVALAVSNLRSATQVGKMEDALEHLVGVQKVTRRSFSGGIAVWEIEVLSDAAPLLARDLEESALLRPFHLTVVNENQAKITATTVVRTVRSANR